MASWTDGPEYAPVERPNDYSVPIIQPLPQASLVLAGPVAPAARPAYEAPRTPGVPLDLITAPVSPQRDPHEAFRVETTPLASGSAPTEPMHPSAAPPMDLPAPPPTWNSPQVNPASFPQPTPPRWQTPRPTPGPPPPVTLAQILTAATPGVLVVLVLGGLVTPLAFPMLLLAMSLATRVHYRRAQVALVFRWVLSVSVALGFLTSVVTYRTFSALAAWDQCNAWSVWMNWGVAVYLMITEGLALKSGEPQEPRP